MSQAVFKAEQVTVLERLAELQGEQELNGINLDDPESRAKAHILLLELVAREVLNGSYKAKTRAARGITP